MRLIFIRHGETQVNVQGKTHQTADPSGLTIAGKKQTIAVIPELQKYAPQIIFSSPENRCLESAKIIANKLKLPIKIINNLRERNWGDWEGKTWNEIKQILDQKNLDDRYTFIPPHGESWQQMEQRLSRALDEILNYNYKTVVVVTHGGALRGLIPVLKNSPKEESFKYDFTNAEVTIFDYDPKRKNN